MEDNKILIELKDQKLSCRFKGPISLTDLMTVYFTLMLSTMRSTIENFEEDPEEYKEAKSAIYDSFNQAASHVLEMFAPEYELRPNLTAQAILEAENRIIMEGRLGEVEANT